MKTDKRRKEITDPVKITTVYGDAYHVSAADLAGTKTMIRLCNKDGYLLIARYTQPNEEMPAYIHRENIAP